jgi:hypothetical protein
MSMTHQELKLRFVLMGIAGPAFPQRNGVREGIRVLGIDGKSGKLLTLDHDRLGDGT